ncbi:hypothetical protein [Geobacillus sp. AYS3]|uniref:hypothetical protein n=1 Tax=Geobacillus sp. AYS3 TaxID=2603623 RepID=UPI00164EDED5|nr:hypothetical protein [Geobacillus sp. AYS3]
MGELGSAVKDKVIGTIKEKFESFSLKETGKNIIEGLINGISSMAHSVYKKAKEIADKVKDTIQSALGIHSPSRVMMEIGKYTVQGLIVGIESESGNLRKAVEKMSDALVPNFRKPIQISEWQRKEMGRIARLGAAERVKAVEEWLSKQYELENIQAKDEVAIWNYVLKTFKLNAEERKRVSLKLRDAKRKVDQEIFENEKKYIEERKKFNQLSLIEELKMWEQVASRYTKGSQKRAEAEENIYRLKKQIYDELTSLNNEYANKVKEVNERLYQDELKAKEEYEARVKEINDRLLQDEIKAREEYEAKVKEINDRLAEEERKLTEEYQKAVEDRTKSLYSFAGLFDEFKRKNGVTGQGLLKNLSDQVSAFKDWQKNISSLASRGIDEGLLQELRDMGPKAVDEIAALNSLSDEELNQYVQLWREKNALAKAQAVNELEGMRLETQTKIQQLRLTANTELEKVKADYINKLTELRAQANAELEQLNKEYNDKIVYLRAQANAELEQHKKEWLTKIREITEGTKTELNLMSASMEDIGKESMRGLIAGLDSMMDPLKRKAQEIADTVRATIQSALDIHSPSRVMMEIGKWIPVGLAEGINRNINAVVSATNRMVRATIPNVAGYSGAVVPATATNNVPKLAGAKIENHFHFHSTAPTPSEVARKNLRVSRQLAMEWGL